jgi:cell division control protein 6
MQQLSLFRDLTVFDSDYLPDNLLFREREIEVLARTFSPMLLGYRPLNNIYIHGSPATGKTSVAKMFLRKLPTRDPPDLPRKKGKRGVVTCYINLAAKSTLAQLAGEIRQEVTGDEGIGRYLPYMEKVFEHLRNTGKSLLLVLDDFNAFPERLDNFLQLFLRPEEYRKKYTDIVTGVLLIASGEVVLNSRVRSTLSPVELEFRNYTVEQKFEILKMRCLQGFGRHAISEKLIMEVAERAADLRHALAVLRYAGGVADVRIRKEHIDEAFAAVKADNARHETSLSELEKFLLRTIRDSPRALSSGELLTKCHKSGYKITIQWLGKRLERLRTMGLITCRFVNGRGRTRVWFPE